MKKFKIIFMGFLPVILMGDNSCRNNTAKHGVRAALLYPFLALRDQEYSWLIKSKQKGTVLALIGAYFSPETKKEQKQIQNDGFFFKIIKTSAVLIDRHFELSKVS